MEGNERTNDIREKEGGKRGVREEKEERGRGKVGQGRAAQEKVGQGKVGQGNARKLHMYKGRKKTSNGQRMRIIIIIITVIGNRE